MHPVIFPVISYLFNSMSFLSHIRQPRTIVKPWRCIGCNTRFTLKAHAANHQKQSQSITFRREGFIYDLVEPMLPVKEAGGHFTNLFILVWRDGVWNAKSQILTQKY